MYPNPIKLRTEFHNFIQLGREKEHGKLDYLGSLCLCDVNHEDDVPAVYQFRNNTFVDFKQILVVYEEFDIVSQAI